IDNVKARLWALADPVPAGARALTCGGKQRVGQGSVRLFDAGVNIRAAREVLIHRGLNSVGYIVRKEDAESRAERPCAGIVGQPDTRRKVVAVDLDGG